MSIARYILEKSISQLSMGTSVACNSHACSICDAMEDNVPLTFEGADAFVDSESESITAEEFRQDPSKAIDRALEAGRLRIDYPDSPTKVTLVSQKTPID